MAKTIVIKERAANSSNSISIGKEILGNSCYLMRARHFSKEINIFRHTLYESEKLYTIATVKARSKEILSVRTFMEFLPIIVFAVAAIALILVVLILSALLRPHVVQSETKLSPYECGEEPIGEARVNFPYSYYVYTIIFAVIDVLSALLFMFAIAFHAPDGFSVRLVIQAFILVGLLITGLVYGLSKVSEVMLSGTEILELRRASKRA